jgi:hypothetical protein
MKKLTEKWLIKNDACQEAVEQWKDEGCEPDLIKVLNRCIELKKYDWGNWLIVRQMTYKQYVSYAVFAAKQVIDIYEKKYPDDKRPRQAIDAAKACIKNPSAKNKAAARAAWAAWAAGAAARAAEAAWAAARAAWAAWAAGAAARAARAAEAAAAGAAWAGAAAAVGATMQEKILGYGIKLLQKEKEDGKTN